MSYILSLLTGYYLTYGFLSGVLEVHTEKMAGNWSIYMYFQTPVNLL